MGSVWQRPLPAQNPIDGSQTISSTDGHVEAYPALAVPQGFPRIATVIHPNGPESRGTAHIFLLNIIGANIHSLS